MLERNYDIGPDEYSKYLKKRGRTGPELQAAIGGAVRLVSHREALLEMGFSTNHVQDGLYGILFDYQGSSGYKSVRWLNPNGRVKGKMLCPAGVAPPCYIPTNLPPFKDRIYFCESAFKALTLTLEGHYAVAGNGVWGLCTKKGFPEQFPKDILERAKEAVILFDSDVESNDQVKRAMQTLGIMLESVYPHLVIRNKVLPPPPDLVNADHWGVDDFYAYYGKEEFKLYMDDRTQERPLDPGQLGRHRLELNVQYAVSGYPAGIVDKRNGRLIKTADFLTTLEANRQYTPIGSGGNDLKPASASKAWVTWEHRDFVEECRYVPGEVEYIKGELYNKWQDSDIKPVEGDISPWVEFLHNAIPRTEEADLLMQMYAYMLQNRGTRSEKVVILISPDQSTGKSTIARVIGEIFGRNNHVSIDPASFKGDFNSHYAEKELVQMDEVVKFTHGDMGRLERYVTDPKVDINRKGWEVYHAPNHMNFTLTSNRPDSIPLKPGERRAFVLEVTPTVWYKQGDKYWDKLNAWLEADGLGIIRWWLETMDLTDYNPRFLPPMNPMKEHMQSVGVDDWETFVIQLRDNPEDVLPAWATKLHYMTPEQMEYVRVGGEGYREGRWQQNVKTMGARLGKYFKQVNGGKPLRFKHGSTTLQKRLWAIYGDHLATNDDVRDNLEAHWLNLDEMDTFKTLQKSNY